MTAIGATDIASLMCDKKLDFSLPLHDIMTILAENSTIEEKIEIIEWINKNHPNELPLYINNVIQEYEYILSDECKNVLITIIEKTTTDIILKVMCCDSVYNITKDITVYFPILTNTKMVNSTRFSILHKLVKSKTYEKEILQFIDLIYASVNIEFLLRELTKFKIKNKYTSILFNKFFEKYQSVYSIYLINGIRYCLSNNIVTTHDLLGICVKHIDSEKSEICDILLTFGKKDSKDSKESIDYHAKGQAVLTELSFDEKSKFRTLYDNKENVHDANINESIKKYLINVLGKINIPVEQGTPSFVKEIMSLRNEKENEKFDKIEKSLKRILLDTSIYDGNHTLKSILTKIWYIINNHQQKTELIKRLLEELESCNGVCGTGYISRLVNTMSTFGFELNIGFDNEINIKINHLLNKKVQEIKDEKEKETVLDELTKDKGPVFYKWYRQVIPCIYSELYAEYVGDRKKPKFVSNDDFDVYFRNATSVFEGVN